MQQSHATLTNTSGTLPRFVSQRSAVYESLPAPRPPTDDSPVRLGDPASAMPVCVLDEAALRLVLASIPGEAIVITTDGRVLLSNAPGAAMARRHSSASLIDIARRAFDGACDEYKILSLPTAAPSVRYFLLIHRHAPLWDLVQERAAQWRLSRRQTQALECLVKGMCNKHIARELDCAVRTVELHVSAVLRASGATSRAEAIALFWSEATDRRATAR